jgi:hypothetical protein
MSEVRRIAQQRDREIQASRTEALPDESARAGAAAGAD